MRLRAGVEPLLLTALAWGVSGQETALHRVKRQFGISFGFPNFNQFGQQSSTGAPGRQEQNVDLGQIFGSVVNGFLNPQSQNQNNNILGAVAGFNQATNQGSAEVGGLQETLPQSVVQSPSIEEPLSSNGHRSWLRFPGNARRKRQADDRPILFFEPSSSGNCATGNGGCEQGCQQQGQFTRCFCNAGFVLNRDRRTCSDINECIFNNAGCSQICNNSPGSFACACVNGFTLLGDKRSCGPGQASPVVGQQPGAFGSCAVNNGGCEQECTVNPNNRSVCRCTAGYRLNPDDKRKCVDINECEKNNGGCSDVCTNTIGSSTCSCQGGLVLGPNGKKCVEPPRSCDVNNGGCHQKCIVNDNGRAVCRCDQGYRLNQVNKTTCDDIDECDVNNGGCSDVCTNTVGSSTCSCHGALVLAPNGKKCVDPPPGRTDGGTNGSCDLNNGGCEQFCRPRRNGSYFCRCRQGFTLNQDQFSCTPITAPPTASDPCSVQNGGCEQLCQQTFAGVRCGCNPGFTLQNDGRACVAVPTAPTGPNCAVANGGCQQLCSASGAFGASPCGCNPGFVINSDGISCTDVNECQVNNGGCQQLCVNGPGTFQCQCQPGFNLVGGNACQAAVTVGPVTAPLRGCGANLNKRINMNTRIVGGKPSNPKDWPWMVALLQTRNTAQFCGGALITSRHVLTAAHCVNQFTVADITVRVGEYDFTITTDNNPSDFKLAEIRAHEQYDTTTQENDIAVLRMERDVTFNEFVQPACLPPPDNQDLAGLNAVVTGWGTTSFGGSVSNVLREVQIPIWTRAECETAYPGKVFPLMMCAGLRAGGKDSCQGDSGGPLVTQFPSSNTWYLVGVVSWGIECARADRPGVYTRVNQYLPWIEQKTST